MSKIPTAEEFEQRYEKELDYLLDNPNLPRYNILQNLFIEFAKLHVKAALEAAADNACINDFDIKGEYSPTIDEDSILSAYPESNIK